MDWSKAVPETARTEKWSSTYSHTDCCCFQCAGLENAESNPDCACETGPVYSRDVCKECPKGTWCDVPKEPQTYPHDDDCQCFKCREYNAEAVRP